MILPTLVFGVPLASVFQAPTLTLDEALSLADKSAFSVRLAASEVERSRQKLAEARGAYGPFLGADFRYTRFDKELSTAFDSTRIIIRPIDQKDLNFSLTMPLDLSGNIARAVDASRFSLLASESSLDAARNTLRLEVRRAYFRAVQARWQVAVAEEALRNAQARLRNAQAQFEAEAIAKVDVLRFQTEVAQRESDLIAARNALALAKNTLNNLLARPIETDFETAEVAFDPQEPAPLEDLVEWAKASRPEVQVLRWQLEALRKIREAQERSLEPSLSLSIVHNKGIDAQGFGASPGTTSGVLTLSIPIFDAETTRSRVRAARQDEEQTRIRLEQAELGVSLDVRQARRTLTDARARLEAADRQVAFAEENYRLAVIKYEAGEGIALEVVDAQTQLTSARTAQVAARYDVLIAYAQLQAAVGKDELQTRR